MTTHAHGEGHGNTVAAWTAVIIMIIGSIVSAAAFWWSAIVVFWIGIGIIVLGAIAGKVLQAMGYGQVKPAATAEPAESAA